MPKDKKPEKHKKPGKHKKAKKVMIHILLFTVCQAVFFTAATIGLVFYGPFTRVKETFVATAMSTMTHKYLATLFLSQEEVDKIMAENNPVVRELDENPDDVVNQNENDKGIEVVDIAAKRYKGKLMIVKDPKRIVLGMAPNLDQGGMTLSQIVKHYGAVGGLNAGGFVDAAGSKPEGVVIVNGDFKFIDTSRQFFKLIGFNNKHVLVVKSAITIQQMKDQHIMNGISFGPPLIINGQPAISSSGSGLQPRSAIGQRKDGTVLLLAIDGRQVSSAGATFLDIQNLLLRYGAYNAANLDGGSSTTMVYNDEILNSPSDILGERSIPSAYLVMP